MRGTASVPILQKKTWFLAYRSSAKQAGFAQRYTHERGVARDGLRIDISAFVQQYLEAFHVPIRRGLHQRGGPVRVLKRNLKKV